MNGSRPDGSGRAGAGGPGQDVLSRAAEQGRLVALVEPSSPLVPILDAAGRRFLRPLHVQVVGRPGVGRDTMARALRERLSLTAIGPGEGKHGAADADLWLLVLAGLPRRADHELLTSLPPDRVVVVLGKADTHGEWETATAVASTCSTRLGVPVQPVSQLLACADLDPAEFAALTAMAQAGEEMPSMAGRFLVGRPGSAERLMRQGLLRRIDAFGIETALALIAAGSAAAGDERTLNRALRDASGVADLSGPIGARVGRVRYWREVEVRAELERAAAGGHDREAVERLLAAPGVSG
ncbi:hypothetical protein [Gordonia jinghuaiqii]|uniref:hypothetical protein n=1 Tax=Gordonia jinghuaiqii TaxID=2758710 RepID=UPI002948C351|nr:hypothetical protein [Gordonia jinghuaiqii]